MCGWRRCWNAQEAGRSRAMSIRRWETESVVVRMEKDVAEELTIGAEDDRQRLRATA
jgi:hypothetical protein